MSSFCKALLNSYVRIAAGILIIGNAASSSVHAGSETVTPVKQTLELVAAKKLTWAEARDLLRNAPSNLVIEEVIQELRYGEFRDAAIRQLAYEILRDHRASKVRSGYEQFVRGLEDPPVSAIAAIGLLEGRQCESIECVVHVRNCLAKYLRTDVPEDQASPIGVLTQVGELGPAG